jgi:hypothetical protein
MSLLGEAACQCADWLQEACQLNRYNIHTADTFVDSR